VLTDQQNNAIISLSTNIKIKNELVKQQRTEVVAVMDRHEPDMPYFDILGRAQAAVFPDEELKAENFNLVNTDGFEKAVVLLKCWAEMTMREMCKEKNFRIEINYNAEAKKTTFAIYTPTAKEQSDSQQEHSEV
jgi:hypothetical protein